MNPTPQAPKLDFNGGLIQQVAERRHLAGAVILSGLCAAATIWILPRSSHLVGEATWFLPATVSLAVLAEVFTSLLLLLQFLRTGRHALLMVSVGYVWASAGMVAQLLVYPGVFSESGLFGASVYSAPWMWLVWHFGFAVSLFAAAVLAHAEPVPPKQRSMAMVASLVLPPVLIALLTMGVLLWGDWLSMALSPGDPTRPVHDYPGLVIWAMGAVALVALAWKTRFRTRLQLWTGVSLLTYLCETLLMLTSIQRFTIGWYFSRGVIVLSALLLLSALLFEVDELYSSANEANFVLHERSIRDSLTNTFLRRYLTEQLTMELGRARRKKEFVSVLMMDVDFFKNYNDVYGHQAGDDCLVEFCRTVELHLRRHGDFLARYGGEEFAVVLPNTRVMDAITVANRIRESVAAMRMNLGEGVRPGAVTVSIGVATAGPESDMDERLLIQAADKALYLAKQGGRDRVVIAGISGAEVRG